MTVTLVKDGTGSTGVFGTGGVTGLGGAGGGGNSISTPSMDSGHDAVFVMGTGGVGGSESTQLPPVTVENHFDAAPIINTNLDGGEGKTCSVTKFELDRSLVDVLILMDISGSMENIVEGTGCSRWVNEYSAILDIVKTTEKDLNWGLKMFPEKDGTTCLVRPSVDVAVGPHNFINIDSAITPLKSVKKPPGDGTPTGDAIFAGIKYLKSLKSTKPQYMILATDGEPNCPVQGASSNRGEADIAAVKSAHDQGVDTFVIGVNEALLTNRILTGMAMAGGRNRPVDPVLEPAFYVAEDKESLVKALKEITGKIASCHFSLELAPPPSPDDVAVDVIKKGATKTPDDRAPRDKTHTNGWDYLSVDYKVIEFYGSWCTKVQNVGVEGNIVEFTFGCPGVAIP
jgi:hypothetical protein